MVNQKDIFSIILASTVHDMKNSLGMMMSSLEPILSEVSKEKEQLNSKHGIVQYEYSRLNNLLMQLLALYKIDNNQLPFNPSYINLFDFIEEQVIGYIPLFQAKGLNYQINVDEDIEAVFDETLMAMVVSNVLGNSIRYAHSEILIQVDTKPYLAITICDDGIGYPAEMLELAQDYIHGINRSTGSTGLGLFFAHKIAEIHHHGENKGFIELANGGALGGGVFKICIP